MLFNAIQSFRRTRPCRHVGALRPCAGRRGRGVTACAGAGRFASLALATEDPRPDLLRRRPYPRDQPLLSAVMLRSMVCHSAWQILLLFALIFAVGDVCEAPGEGARCVGRAAHDALGDLKSGRPSSFDRDVYVAGAHCVPAFDPAEDSTFVVAADNATKVPLRAEEYCSDEAEADGLPTQHYTLVFTAFVMMQLVNQVRASASTHLEHDRESLPWMMPNLGALKSGTKGLCHALQINARKIHGEANVLSGVMDNPLFLGIMAMEFIMQIVMVHSARF